ncbi:MAG: hypothetical protein H0T15_09515 [Thermoleophilaceae bacterium]|nr:hypothetical protein [Thermoleophilaceae bacterium]
MLRAVLAAAAVWIGACGGDEQAPLFGITNDQPVSLGTMTPERYAAELNAAGAGVARVQVNWIEAEPDAPGVWRNRAYHERLGAALREQGIRPLLVVIGSPRWAQDPADERWCAYGRSVGIRQCFNPPARERDPAWAEFVAGAVEIYRQADPVAIEVWNEPNARSFWLGGPDPGRYVELLCRAHEAVRRSDPDLPVISAGMHLHPADPPHYLGAAGYIASVYSAGGGRCMDGVGVHPYSFRNDLEDLPTWEAVIDDARRATSEAGDGSTPLWITEIGEHTGGAPSPVDPDRQAAGLVAAWEKLRNRGDIRAFIVHTLVDNRATGSDYGLLDAAGRRKPAYCQLRRAVTGENGCPPAR